MTSYATPQVQACGGQEVDVRDFLAVETELTLIKYCRHYDWNIDWFGLKFHFDHCLDARNRTEFLEAFSSLISLRFKYWKLLSDCPLTSWSSTRVTTLPGWKERADISINLKNIQKNFTLALSQKCGCSLTNWNHIFKSKTLPCLCLLDGNYLHARSASYIP